MFGCTNCDAPDGITTHDQITVQVAMLAIADRAPTAVYVVAFVDCSACGQCTAVAADPKTFSAVNCYVDDTDGIKDHLLERVPPDVYGCARLAVVCDCPDEHSIEMFVWSPLPCTLPQPGLN